MSSASCRPPQFNVADRIFICLGHHDLSGLAAVHAPRDYVSTTTPSPYWPVRSIKGAT
jgi:hypothetical protein